MPTTATLEEYLETILRLSPQSESVRPTDIAEQMKVKAPTVTATLSRLRDRGYIERVGKGVVLTDSGREYASDILRKHRIAERFLVDMLGFDPATVHNEACELEHAISPRILDALERILDNPQECPHGQPIPEVSRMQKENPL